MKSKQTKILELKARYRTLSEIEDLFPKNSVHPVAKQVDKKMAQVIKEIETLEKSK